MACGRNGKEQELEYENNVQDVQKENGTEEEEYSEQEDSGDTNTGIENDNFSQEQEEVIEEVQSRMEILFEISAGTEMGEIGYKDTLERMRGPESFIVNGKDIYILDTINRRILIYEGETLAGGLGVCAGAQDFVVYKNNFFVLDNDKTIYEYNPEGVIISENILPGNKDYSDVDICLFGKDITHLVYAQIVMDIEEINTPLSFDIVNFNELSKEKFINNILTEGIEIYNGKETR